MSRIMPAFCSSVRPAAMLMVISGIFVSLCCRHGRAAIRFSPIKQDVDIGHKAGHDVSREWLVPSDGMASENLPHGIDELRSIDLVLRLGMPLEIFLAILDFGETAAKDQILDLRFGP